MIQEAISQRQTRDFLFNKSVSVFRTVVKMVRHIPEVMPILRHIYTNTPQFFDSRDGPP